MPIKQRDTWSNPYATDSRLNGMRSGRLGWRDLNDDEREGDAASGIVHAFVFAFMAWAAVGLVVALWKGWI
jgi:hypothetical protein